MQLKIPHQLKINLASIDLSIKKPINISLLIRRDKISIAEGRNKRWVRSIIKEEPEMFLKGRPFLSTVASIKEMIRQATPEARWIEIGLRLEELGGLVSKIRGSLWGSWRRRKKGKGWILIKYTGRQVFTGRNDFAYFGKTSLYCIFAHRLRNMAPLPRRRRHQPLPLHFDTSRSHRVNHICNYFSFGCGWDMHKRLVFSFLRRQLNSSNPIGIGKIVLIKFFSSFTFSDELQLISLLVFDISILSFGVGINPLYLLLNCTYFSMLLPILLCLKLTLNGDVGSVIFACFYSWFAGFLDPCVPVVNIFSYIFSSLRISCVNRHVLPLISALRIVFDRPKYVQILAILLPPLPSLPSLLLILLIFEIIPIHRITPMNEKALLPVNHPPNHMRRGVGNGRGQFVPEDVLAHVDSFDGGLWPASH